VGIGLSFGVFFNSEILKNSRCLLNKKLEALLVESHWRAPIL